MDPPARSAPVVWPRYARRGRHKVGPYIRGSVALPLMMPVTSAAVPPLVSGGVRVLFVRDRARPGGASRLASLYQHEPMRVLFPDPLDDPMPAAVLINTA